MYSLHNYLYQLNILKLLKINKIRNIRVSLNKQVWYLLSIKWPLNWKRRKKEWKHSSYCHLWWRWHINRSGFSRKMSMSVGWKTKQKYVLFFSSTILNFCSNRHSCFQQKMFFFRWKRTKFECKLFPDFSHQLNLAICAKKCETFLKTFTYKAHVWWLVNEGRKHFEKGWKWKWWLDR